MSPVVKFHPQAKGDTGPLLPEAFAELDFERTKANRRKDEFLAMLGHELRNPLAPLVTTLELIRVRGRDPLAMEHALMRARWGTCRAWWTTCSTSRGSLRTRSN